MGGLKVVEHTLKCQWNALCRIVIFRRDLVNGLGNGSVKAKSEEMTRYLSEFTDAEETAVQHSYNL